ncbi:MAG: hypothetical protein Q4G22_04695 [Paracoccus sp. (in: a-proteobacteria)]|uniref:hypothetical protein n=1 Tax=Paracoccus sp. TaxID=267 RepID=UPI0026DEFC04|nr:hypothetical protein [Paracoccus sp. (in: a-proteobacteria)]MDO5631117.1 hypothetical protein [Paracoccus sp. (in: a-proteobacteria)]
MNSLLAEFAATILPAAVQLIGAALGLLLIRAANVARDRWGIEIEARHREALHSALMSGIRAAILKGLRGDAAVDMAIAHATASVPDALSRLQPSADVLISIATAKLEEVLPLISARVDA